MNFKQQQKQNSSSLPKIIPHSDEAEQAVLGGLMLDNDAWDSVVEWLTENDFYRPEHRIIFNLINTLASEHKPFDVLTLAEALKLHDRLQQVGGQAYLAEMEKNTPSVANTRVYAEIVRERSVLRQLLDTANDIADTAFNPRGYTISELLDAAERRVFAIAEQGTRVRGPESIQTLLSKAVDRIDTMFRNKSSVTGLSTGFTDLDRITSGLQDGELVIIAGRPSMGKTMLGTNIVEYAALRADVPVLVFSLEMPGEAIAMRMISSLARINQQHLRTGHLSDDDWHRIRNPIGMLAEAKLFIDDTPAIGPTEMRARARRVVREHGKIGLIMVDYLQLMTVPGSIENRTNEVSEISRSLKTLAKEMNCPVVALSQLSRALEQRSNRRPTMSDLRESGAIEQDADVIAFIYRDEVYNPDSPQKGIAEIIIGKQRNGPIGSLNLTFRGEFTRFEDYVSDNYVNVA